MTCYAQCPSVRHFEDEVKEVSDWFDMVRFKPSAMLTAKLTSEIIPLKNSGSPHGPLFGHPNTFQMGAPRLVSFTVPFGLLDLAASFALFWSDFCSYARSCVTGWAAEFLTLLFGAFSAPSTSSWNLSSFLRGRRSRRVDASARRRTIFNSSVPWPKLNVALRTFNVIDRPRRPSSVR
jgi:hypothetical protein